MLTSKDIIREGHPTLRKTAQEVQLPPSQEDQKTLEDMLDYLKNSQNPQIAEENDLRPGVGLAAPQINVSKRMIAVHFEDEGVSYSYGLFNPKIVSHSVQQSFLTAGEGCLSVDRPVPGYVPRYAKIRVKATALDGTELDLRLKGMAAIVFQHEIDHLNGVMFYDRMSESEPFSIPEGAVAVER
ncbi:peptide deformylase [Bacillus sp. FJAT-42376]|uniref:peptide deformylase n=1 Tax=Bacillus sp. FJAT-42376 TaxID=2014076 RepID=UPI000F4F7A16|nr:peptide deformylase [Bacillus sp. FJAT-42376]AZB42767.1 peptide deformylase [Bacillus sp. FJAT-42376]